VYPADTSPTTYVPAAFTGVAVDAIVVAVELPAIVTVAKLNASVLDITTRVPVVPTAIPVPASIETNVGLALPPFCTIG